jgi:flagellar biosynthesis/type III secretory pathway protein FliH
MGLIKNEDALRIPSQGFQDLGDLKHQAEKLLQEARDEARAIVGEAREQARTLNAEAQPRGHEEGLQRGLAEGREQGRREGREAAIQELHAELDQLLAAWTAAVESFDTQRNDLLLAAREEILELALAMGAKITHRVIDADRSVVNDQVAETLALVTDASAVTVTVNPHDKAVLDEALSAIVERIGLSAHVELGTDDAIARGGCVVTTGKGRVDASVDRQIERIVETLLPGGGDRGTDTTTEPAGDP